MKIRTHLAIRFTLIVTSLFIIFALAVFYFSSSYRENTFYERLRVKASDYAKLLTVAEGISLDHIKIFDKNTAYMTNERIIVYDDKNVEIFNTFEDSASPPFSLLNRVRIEKEIKYKKQKTEVIAVLYPNKNKNYVVIVSALDSDGLNNLKNLKWILITGLIIFVVASMFAGWFFAGLALNPITKVIKEVENIGASNLTQRVTEINPQDEIGQLANTFNRMLERIQKSFELQKSFVSNSSHELRTPLTAITGQLEVALMNKREPEEYSKVLNSVLEDIKSINRLTNGLLELTQADMDIAKLSLKPLRIDELIWQTRNNLLKRNAHYKFNIDTTGFPDDENKLIINGSEHLLGSAFINIMDNACKFSPRNEVTIFFKFNPNSLVVSFLDHGIGISEEDLRKIARPFYRGNNAKQFQGHGLGLSLTLKLISLHKGDLKIISKVNQFTNVIIEFPYTRTA